MQTRLECAVVLVTVRNAEMRSTQSDQLWKVSSDRVDLVGRELDQQRLKYYWRILKHKTITKIFYDVDILGEVLFSNARGE